MLGIFKTEAELKQFVKDNVREKSIFLIDPCKTWEGSFIGVEYASEKESISTLLYAVLCECEHRVAEREKRSDFGSWVIIVNKEEMKILLDKVVSEYLFEIEKYAADLGLGINIDLYEFDPRPNRYRDSKEFERFVRQ